MLRVIKGTENGGYCKGPTQMKAYASFCLMTDSELVNIMMFLEKQINIMIQPRVSLLRAFQTLKAVMEFRNLDTEYITQLLKRTKDRLDVLHQEFTEWTRQHEKNAFSGEFRASSSNVAVSKYRRTRNFTPSYSRQEYYYRSGFI